MNDVMQSTLNGLPAADPIAIVDKETKETPQTYADVMLTADEYANHRVDSVRNTYYAETNVREPRDGEGAWGVRQEDDVRPVHGRDQPDDAEHRWLQPQPYEPNEKLRRCNRDNR